MDSNCPNCNEKFSEIFFLPCTHNFCSKCTDLMKNGAEITCLLCSKSCHQDEVKRNTFLEKVLLIKDNPDKNKSSIIMCDICDPDDNTIEADKYCVECDQFMCEKCLRGHVRTKLGSRHQIVDKDDKKKFFNKSSEQFCEKHKQNFSIYCKICEVIMCPTCWIKEHFDHAKLENLEDNLEKVFAESTADIKEKISKMNNIIENQNILIGKNKKLENNYLKNYDDLRNAIEKYASELKDHIDVIKNAMILQINSIQNQLLKSINNNINEINNYIDSLTAKKLYYTDIIINESNMNIFNLKRELTKANWIEDKSEKEIKNIEITFEKPSLEKMISSELLKSFKVNSGEDLEILILKNNTFSACIFDDKFYTVYNEDNIINIDIYDKKTMTYNTSIDFKPNITNKIIETYIVNTQNNLFLYYQLESDERTYLFKLKDENKTFVELKTLEKNCRITSTYQQTLLVRTSSNQLLELSENGDELRRITIPDAGIQPLLYYFFYDHQLKDKRYIVTSYDLKSVAVSLLDTQGTFIKSFTQQSTAYITTCTDGEKYIFVLERDVGKITVLSTNLQYLHEFSYPGVKQIYFDKINDKVLLVKDNEIIYFTYYLGKEK